MLKLYDKEETLVTGPNKVGEVCSRSPMLLTGHWKEPEKLAAAMKEETVGYCRGKMASSGSNSVTFIKDKEIPRAGTGKVLHRLLREKYGMWKDNQ